MNEAKRVGGEAKSLLRASCVTLAVAWIPAGHLAGCSEGSGAESTADEMVVVEDGGGAADVDSDDGGWSVESHTKEGAPNYDKVFPENAVNRIDVTVAPADWQAMLDDLESMLGEFGAGAGGPGGGGLPPGGVGPGGGGPGSGGPPPGGFGDGGLPEGGPDGGGPGGGQPGGGGALSLLPRDPIYVSSTVRFEGRRWEHVGLRFKGNSSIVSAWRSGVGKIPLRFNFSKLKSDYSEVASQRFWGFKDLSLSNINADSSMIREKLTNDFLREVGIPVGRSAFYRVYVDHGEGPLYMGLYTATEMPEDQFLDGAFGSDEGNLYKPESTFAKFVEEEFEKKTNEDAEDFSDVQAFITVLNSDRSDALQWREGLDATFDTAGFLRWLAANTLVGNWDVYGAMAHNYYLYADPSSSGRLTWIAWDSSLAFQVAGNSAAFDMSNISSAWPLIRNTFDDGVYRATYYDALREISSSFTHAKLAPKIQAAHDLVAPYVVGVDGERVGFTFLSNTVAFTGSVATLESYVKEREAAVEQALIGH